MKKLLLSLISYLLISNLIAQDMLPVTTFGNGTGFATSGSGEFVNDYMIGHAVQSDGKLLAAGFSTDASFKTMSVVFRQQVNGNLDSSFGTNGMIKMDLVGGTDQEGFNAIYELPNKKILVTGFGGLFNGNFYCLRFNSNGVLDSSYGTNGKGMVYTGGKPTAIASQFYANGSVIVAGYSDFTTITELTLAKFKPDGNPDSTFGSDGLRLKPIGQKAYTKAINSDLNGRILLTGSTYDGNMNGTLDLFVVRLKTDGTNDSTFNIDGSKIITFNSFSESGNSIVEDANHKVIVGGFCNSNINNADSIHSLVIRLNEDGSFDNSFNGTGTKIITHSRGSDIRQVWLKGNIIMCLAYWQEGIKSITGIYALQNNGTYATSFATNGIAKGNIFGGTDGIYQVFEASNNEYLLAGFTNNSINNNYIDNIWAKVKIANSTMVESSNQKLYDINIYPNPASSKLVLTSEKIIHHIQIRSIDGRLIQQFEIENKMAQIDVNKIPSGLVLLQIYCDGIMTSKKIQISH